MILARVHPGPAEAFELDAAGTRERLLELYSPPAGPWVRLNLVTSVSGSAAGSDGTSETLTSAADRRILGVIRELADVVLVGAQSVRAEGYVRPKRAPLAVVTGSGDLEGHRITGRDGPPIVVLCPPDAEARARASLPDAEIITVAGPRMSAPDILSALREHGFASVVCEGGPGLARQLVVAGVVDEVCLTTSPRLTGVTLPLFGAGAFPEVGVELAHLILDEESTLYARWAVTRGGRASA
ncbi:pyrimidine reductase family protein [soil metagenome]